MCDVVTKIISDLKRLPSGDVQLATKEAVTFLQFKAQSELGYEIEPVQEFGMAEDILIRRATDGKDNLPVYYADIGKETTPSSKPSGSFNRPKLAIYTARSFPMEIDQTKMSETEEMRLVLQPPDHYVAVIFSQASSSISKLKADVMMMSDPERYRWNVSEYEKFAGEIMKEAYPSFRLGDISVSTKEGDAKFFTRSFRMELPSEVKEVKSAKQPGRIRRGFNWLFSGETHEERELKSRYDQSLDFITWKYPIFILVELNRDERVLLWALTSWLQMACTKQGIDPVRLIWESESVGQCTNMLRQLLAGFATYVIRYMDYYNLRTIALYRRSALLCEVVECKLGPIVLDYNRQNNDDLAIRLQRFDAQIALRLSKNIPSISTSSSQSAEASFLHAVFPSSTINPIAPVSSDNCWQWLEDLFPGSWTFESSGLPEVSEQMINMANRMLVASCIDSQRLRSNPVVSIVDNTYSSVNIDMLTCAPITKASLLKVPSCIPIVSSCNDCPETFQLESIFITTHNIPNNFGSYPVQEAYAISTGKDVNRNVKMIASTLHVLEEAVKPVTITGPALDGLNNVPDREMEIMRRLGGDLKTPSAFSIAWQCCVFHYNVLAGASLQTRLSPFLFGLYASSSHGDKKLETECVKRLYGFSILSRAALRYAHSISTGFAINAMRSRVNIDLLNLGWTTKDRIEVGNVILGGGTILTKKRVWDNVDWNTFMVALIHINWTLVSTDSTTEAFTAALYNSPTPDSVSNQFGPFLERVLLNPWLERCRVIGLVLQRRSDQNQMRVTMANLIIRLESKDIPVAQRILDLHDAMIVLNILWMASLPQYSWVDVALQSPLTKATNTAIVGQLAEQKERKTCSDNPGLSDKTHQVKLTLQSVQTINGQPMIRLTEKLSQLIWMWDTPSALNAMRIWFQPWTAILTGVNEYALA